jgi:hypothetical protein
MWEAAIALINRLDAGHILFLIIVAGREWMSWQERKLFGEALSKLVESMHGVKITIAAITGKA